MGCTDVRRALESRARRPDGRRLRGSVGRREDRSRSDSGGVDGQCARRHQCRQQRVAARARAPLEKHSGDARREHVRDRFGGSSLPPSTRSRPRAVDFALALGVEKLEGTPVMAACRCAPRGSPMISGCPTARPQGSFAQLAGAYAARNRIDHVDLKRAMGACELEEPSERRVEPARASAQSGRHRDDFESADDLRSAGVCSIVAASRTALLVRSSRRRTSRAGSGSPTPSPSKRCS